MLDTFSFEPYIKSYHWFTFRSLEFSEIAFRSLSSSLACLLLCFPPTAPRRPPPRWTGRRPTPTSPLLRAGTYASPRSRPPSSRWCSQAVPRTLAASRDAVPPPPQRRGGEPAAVPQTTNSRALENPEHRSLLFPSLICPLSAPKPQNAAATSIVAGELRSATDDPLPPSPCPNPRHHELRLAPLNL